MLLQSKSFKNVLFVFSATLIGCSQTNSTLSSTALFAPKPANLRVNLTDAPNEELSTVNVNVSHVELWLEKEGNEKRLIIAQNLGNVDLLTLQNGVLLPLQDITMPEGVAVKHIRVILNDTGHFAVKISGQICELRTPSAQQTGIKIQLGTPIVFENNHSYSLVIDFDAKKSVVQMGNGNCLLKPVLKLKSATRLPSEDVDDDGNSETPGEELGGGEANDDTVNDGFDPTDPSTWPPDITEEELIQYF